MTQAVSANASMGEINGAITAADVLGDGHIGAELRSARKAMGESLDEVSKTLHISENYLRAIEDLDTAALPSLGYVLGFMRSYAKYLGFDVASAVERYKTESEIPRDLGKRDAPHFVSRRQIRLPRGSVAAFMTLGAFAVLAGWYGMNSQAEAAAPVNNATNVDLGLAMPVPTKGDPSIVALRASTATWVRVSDDKGNVITSRIFVPGELFEARIDDNYTFSARDGGALELYRGGELVGHVAAKGASIQGVSLR